MKKGIMILVALVFTLVPLGAAMSQAADTGSHESHHAGVTRLADTGNRFCMSGSTMMDSGMMSGMMTGSPRHAGNAKTSPDCGMSESDCSANHLASCGPYRAGESRARECGA